MKNIINEIKTLQTNLSEKNNELSNHMEDKFGVEITLSDCLTIVRNDFYSCNIWFFSRSDEIKPSSCNKMPETEEEVIELFKSKSTQEANIIEAVKYLLEICEAEVCDEV